MVSRQYWRLGLEPGGIGRVGLLLWKVAAVAFLYKEDTEYRDIKRETEGHGDDDPGIV